MEEDIKDIKVKYEVLDMKASFEEKDIPEYVNVNTISDVRVKTEASEKVQQDIFQCGHCPNKYKKNTYLLIHAAVHDPRRCCPICYEAFTCKKKLGHHLNQHIKYQMKVDKKLAFSCQYCEKYFNTKKKFVLHVRVHTNERPHKCEICGEGFKQAGTLKDHYVTHTKEKRFACEICNGCFTTSSSLKRHKRKMHDRGKTINCKHCDAKFLNMADFRAHKNDVHPNKCYKRTCPLCSETCRSRFTYRIHQQYHDDLDKFPRGKDMFTKYYLCVLCGEKLPALNLYLDHRRSHLNYTVDELEEARKNNVFKCKFCSYQFVAKSTLFKHIDVHMAKDFKCDICQTLFTYSGLKAHMKTAHQMLRCRVCRETLLGRSNLYFHYQKFHPNVQKPFACSICGNQYVRRNQLNAHFKLYHETNSNKNFKFNVRRKIFLKSSVTQVHNKQTKYKCPTCKFVCMTRKEMLTHKIIHKKSRVRIQICDEKFFNGMSHKRFRCKLCKMVFKSSKSCRIHLSFRACRKHLEKRKRKEVANNNRCLVCSKKFATVETLRRHMLLHSSSICTCRFCDKKFKMIRMMRRHVQVRHPGEKIFRCETCNEEFDKIRQYVKHNSKHKIEVECPVQINSCTDLDAVIKTEVIKQEPKVENLYCE